ncbi:glyoxal oxidase N-terminus-domain-containing protein [Daedaleopsis nitida]|nr:glyoxal oxidase N-terminus-domain-containing protein [Daedaleopsis nitida]
MINRQLSLLALSLGAASIAFAQQHKAGSFEDGGHTSVSAMMMFLGNTDKVYILDKSEANAVKFGNYPAMGAVYDIATRQSTPMGVVTNVFCASGMHLPNGSFATFGGNGAVGPGGNIGDTTPPATPTPLHDFSSTKCQWFDDPAVLHMQKQRWYSAAEPMGDGTIVLIGGFSNGGYINRNYPNVDPAYEGGAAQPTYEFFPNNGQDAQVMNFMVKTSGLNSYAHTFLMPSGKMLVQANYSTILWDPLTNVEEDLPDMPGQIVRVYPASGAVAMLPLTPDNGYNPSVLFCGGSDMTDYQWGNYSWPFADTWTIPASKKCHSITPEPTDGSTVDYVEDDDMPEGRTMGQFIALPDLTFLVVNGGQNGTAGYSDRTLNTLQLPFGKSLASEPVGRPAIYNPRATKGQRWSFDGFDTSPSPVFTTRPPSCSLMRPSSSPAEVFYPLYFSATTRPTFTGAPTTLTYGGDAFDLTVPASAYGGSANDAADKTIVTLIRGGWTTHAMNMGQRAMQLKNSYTVNNDGSITLHVAQPPPNSNLFQPGPALLFVVMNGIPSNGSWVTVGSGNIEKQPTLAESTLPANVRVDNVSGSGSSSSNSNTTSSTGGNSGSKNTAAIVGGIIAAIAAVGILGAVFGICMARRRREAARQASALSYPMSSASGGAVAAPGARAVGSGFRSSDSSAFMPLSQGNESATWGPNASTMNLNSPSTPYFDDARNRSGEFDPYHQNMPRMSTNAARGPY